MCLLISKPTGLVISDDYLYSGFSINSHGAGFAIAKDGVVSIHKGFFTFDAFLKAYKRMSEDQELPALIHFRLATSGYQNKDNCHPFAVGPYAMGHNGVISSLSYSTDKSDTRILAEKLSDTLQDIPDILEDDNFLEDLENIVGYNKISFLKPDGNFIFLNEKSGSWDGGVWYSNGGYRTRTMPNSFRSGDSCSFPSPSKPKSHFCKGKDCNKILRSQTDIETGYCIHCATENIATVEEEDIPWYEERLSFWENRKWNCSESNCNGTCSVCQDHFNAVIMEEASKDNFVINYNEL